MFPCPSSRQRNWSRDTGSAVPSLVSLLISILGLNLVLTHGIPPASGGGVHRILVPPTALGQSRVYQPPQMRAYGVHCRMSAGTGQAVVLKVVRVTGAAFPRFTINQLIFCLSFPTPTIGIKWACSSISRIMYTVHTGTMDMHR